MGGKSLFDRAESGLALTDAGRVVFNYTRNIRTQGPLAAQPRTSLEGLRGGAREEA
jgi:hypothetical protein